LYPKVAFIENMLLNGKAKGVEVNETKNPLKSIDSAGYQWSRRDSNP
jgi:hypothetical protein